MILGEERSLTQSLLGDARTTSLREGLILTCLPRVCPDAARIVPPRRLLNRPRSPRPPLLRDTRGPVAIDLNHITNLVSTLILFSTYPLVYKAEYVSRYPPAYL